MSKHTQIKINQNDLMMTMAIRGDSSITQDAKNSQKQKSYTWPNLDKNLGMVHLKSLKCDAQHPVFQQTLPEMINIIK